MKTAKARPTGRVSSRMAFLLFLTGQRVDDVVELNPAATLTLGSSRDAHIQVLDDPDVGGTHGQVFPAEGSYWFQDLGQGYTYLNLDPLSNATHALRPHDMLIVGRTFLKFVTERPSQRAAGAGDAERKLAAHKKEIDRLRERLTDSQSDVSKTRRELSQSLAELERVRAAHRAERAESRELSTLAFERFVERDQLEGELRELRGRATELAVALAVGEAPTPESP